MIDLMTKRISATNGDVVAESDRIRLTGYNLKYGKKSYVKPMYYTFVFEKEFLMQDYFVMFYSCMGLRREYVCRKPFIFAITESGEEPLVCYDDISIDGRIHSIMIKSDKVFNCKAIKIQYAIDRRKNAYFDVYEMYTCTENELPAACSKGVSDRAENFDTFDLSEYFNSTYSSECQELIDGGRFFDKENVLLYNIPFKVKTCGNNMVAPPPPPAENDDIIDNFGVSVIRKQARPISRDSKFEILVNSRACELYFIMSMSGKRHKRWNYAQDGTALGALTGEVYMPLLVEDTVGFMVEVLYKNGNRDTALPLNLSLGRHGVSGDISVYGVPLDESGEIEKIVFHNKLLDTDCSVIAVTFNKTDNRLHPEMLIPEFEKKTEFEIPTEKNIELKNNILKINNNALSMKIDITNGMELVELRNSFVPGMKISKGSMVKLRTEENGFVENFKPVDANVSNNGAEIIFAHDELILSVSIMLCDDNDIKWRLDVKNAANDVVKTGILFPCILGIDNGTTEDNWYFVPKYRNILSNETVFVYEESSPGFPMQFMDVFSQKKNGGLSITTQERETVTRIYSLDKSEKGIEVFVEYPEMYGEILPGESFSCSPTVLTAHEGTWKKAYNIYKNWIDSWYKPYKCQDKDWYRKCFWLLTEYSDFVMEEKPINKLPLWNDPETGELKFKYVLDEQKKISGCYPDILHLWSSWVHRMENGILKQKWGNYGDEDFAIYGGAERLKNALHEVVEDKGVNVSLYLHPTLLSECYPHTEHFFKGHKVINDVGDNITIFDTTYRMCHAEEEWRNFVIDMYKKVYETLKIPLLYVDEFALRVENRCYNEKHSHSIPSSLLKTDIEFISGLREEMPEEVVLYGEYTAPDIYNKYIDCNITYYVTDILSDMIETSWEGRDGDDTLSRLYLNMYRFAFPKIVQLVLPTAMRNLSWHPQKFIFFNGEAVYDSLWDCEESEGQEFNTKSFKIKKEYADCFASDNPEGMIETLSPAICANCFPGKDRTIYTIYNRAYTTYRGKILKLLHKDGAKYYDVWNDRELDVFVRDGFAEISLTVDAQEIGCILVSE